VAPTTVSVRQSIPKSRLCSQQNFFSQTRIVTETIQGGTYVGEMAEAGAEADESG